MTDDKELTLEESVGEVMKTLPSFLRTYLSEGKYTPVAQNLMSKYGLRIDQGGILERELLLLLMGIENPTEFAEALTDEAKIDPEKMNGIIKDINDLIFAPLRAQERGMVQAAQAQAAAPRPAVPAPQPRPKVVVFNQQSGAKPAAAAPAHIAPLPPKTVMPASGMTLHDAVRAALGSKPADKLMLDDHEEQHIDMPQAAPKAQVPVMQSRPAVPSPTMPAPKAPVMEVEPKPAAPAAPVMQTPAPAPKPPMPPAPPAPIPPRPAPPATPGIPQVSKTPPPPITSYSVDPYREPIDEN